MNPAPRVVLDTNVVLSAIVFKHGRLAPLRQAWHAARCLPLVSQATAAELMRALGYPKFRLSADDRRELLADYLPCCATVRMPVKTPKTPACRDAFDVPFLQLALAGRADYLVTGDADLRSLAERFSCPIITAQSFLTRLAERTT
ncbi:MAG: putative toxin-antitoxin system toxin component, PIN family [bacterium]